MATKVKAKASGDRYNSGKLQLNLVSTQATEGMVRVLMWAAEHKYDAWNFAKGLDIHEVINSLERHTMALKRGEVVDSESGLPIADHIQCNAMFLSHYYHHDQWDGLVGELECNALAAIMKPKRKSSGRTKSRVSPKKKSRSIPKRKVGKRSVKHSKVKARKRK